MKKRWMYEEKITDFSNNNGKKSIQIKNENAFLLKSQKNKTTNQQRELKSRKRKKKEEKLFYHKNN